MVPDFIPGFLQVHVLGIYYLLLVSSHRIATTAHDVVHMFASSPAALLRNVLRVLIPVSIALNIYLYSYPAFSLCAFPLPENRNSASTSNGAGEDAAWSAFVETVKLHLPLSLRGNASAARQHAPFRLLALGDPQLEGDTSIPNAYSASFPHLNRVVDHVLFRSTHGSLLQRVRQTLHDTVDFYLDDIPNTLESIRKRIDLFGNDFYLAHIYHTVRWWAAPTHVAVLGDLLGSQWVSDDEFEKRASRYWNRVVRGSERISDELALFPSDEYLIAGCLDCAPSSETEAWTRRLINVAGNHDIGYAGDINDDRLQRFERQFGRANYELRFEIPLSSLSPAAAASVYHPDTNPDSRRLAPQLRIVNLNDMNLDTPALNPAIQDATYNFVNAVINTAAAVDLEGHFTLVLTHVPLHKPEGVCVDAPLFEFHDHDGSLKEQNMLSPDASRGFLQGIFGMSGDPDAPGSGKGRQGVILNGHDHEGCDTFHFINQLQGASPANRSWDVMRWTPARDGGIVGKPGHPGVREITVRSMMGDFGGNAGLLSVWFDEETWDWKFDFATCALGRQHFWWLVHILDFVILVFAPVYICLAILRMAGLYADRWPSSWASSTAAARKPQRSPPDTKPVGNGKPPGNGKPIGNGKASKPSPVVS